MTSACERLAAIWDVPHHGAMAAADTLEELKAEIRHLADYDLQPVILWAFDNVQRGRFQFWIVYALSTMSATPGISPAKTSRARSADSRAPAGVRRDPRRDLPLVARLPGRSRPGRHPLRSSVTHRGPYKRRRPL